MCRLPGSVGVQGRGSPPTRVTKWPNMSHVRLTLLPADLVSRPLKVAAPVAPPRYRLPRPCVVSWVRPAGPGLRRSPARGAGLSGCIGKCCVRECSVRTMPIGSVAASRDRLHKKERSGKIKAVLCSPLGRVQTYGMTRLPSARLLAVPNPPLEVRGPDGGDVKHELKANRRRALRSSGAVACAMLQHQFKHEAAGGL